MATFGNPSIGFVLWIFLSGHLSSFSSAERAATIIPLYIYPGTNSNGVHSWQALIDAKSAFPQVPVYAIVNVDSGPGNKRLREFTTGLQKLRKAGIKTLAYVATNYSARAEGAVQADIGKWTKFYPDALDGIFFDEMSNENTNTSNRKSRSSSKLAVSYYTDLAEFANDKGLDLTVGNPGADTQPEFVGSVDTIIIFETNTGFPDNSKLGGWHRQHAKENWGILPYNIPRLSETDVRNAKGFVRFVYVTDDNLPNPWDTLPPYLNQLFRVLNEE